MWQPARATFPGMGYARFETATLGEVDETYYYGANCKACGHHSRLSLPKLRDYLGASFPLIDIRLRLACERCGARDPTICFLTPQHSTGNLVQFFHHKPR